MHPSRLIITLVASLAVGVAGFATLGAGANPTSEAERSRSVAVAKLVDANGAKVGKVRFTQRGTGPVDAVAEVYLPAASPEFHGFHVHANADGTGCVPGSGFTGVGGHWDVSGGQHGGHTGDLPSLQRRSDGRAEITVRLDKFDVSDLVGKAVIVHAGPDNFANVPLGPAANQYTDNGTAFSGTGGTAATGNAGGRFACGVIVAG